MSSIPLLLYSLLCALGEVMKTGLALFICLLLYSLLCALGKVMKTGLALFLSLLLYLLLSVLDEQCQARLHDLSQRTLSGWSWRLINNVSPAFMTSANELKIELSMRQKINGRDVSSLTGSRCAKQELPSQHCLRTRCDKEHWPGISRNFERKFVTIHATSASAAIASRTPEEDPV